MYKCEILGHYILIERDKKFLNRITSFKSKFDPLQQYFIYNSSRAQYARLLIQKLIRKPLYFGLHWGKPNPKYRNFRNFRWSGKLGTTRKITFSELYGDQKTRKDLLIYDFFPKYTGRYPLPRITYELQVLINGN